MSEIFKKEEYEEPRCLLCMEKQTKFPINRIPTNRVIDKLDEYLRRDDPEGAKRHLCYWLVEARTGNDQDGELTILNELMGISRNTGDKENAYKYAEEGLELVKLLGLSDHVSGATTYLNAATVYKTFDEPEKAIALYKEALQIYDSELDENDYRIGGLCNNMGLALEQIGDFEQASEAYFRALQIMSVNENCMVETAITYLNLADLIRDRDGYEQGEGLINEYLDKAEKALDDQSTKRDGNYAYMCSKCAAVFGYYGRFAFESELNERVRSIYERN